MTMKVSGSKILRTANAGHRKKFIAFSGFIEKDERFKNQWIHFPPQG